MMIDEKRGNEICGKLAAVLFAENDLTQADAEMIVSRFKSEIWNAGEAIKHTNKMEFLRHSWEKLRKDRLDIEKEYIMRCRL